MQTGSIIDDYDELDRGFTVRERPRAQPRMAPWREAERYFKRYRDTKKVIPLRPKTQDNGKTNP